MIYLIKNNKIKVSALIIQNSWGPNVGLNADGEPEDSTHRRGRFVFTVDYLKETGVDSSGMMYDFMISSEVAKQFPNLKSETEN